MYNYIAPIYNTHKLEDKKLLKQINKLNPDFILTNLGGGHTRSFRLIFKKKFK